MIKKIKELIKYIINIFSFNKKQPMIKRFNSIEIKVINNDKNIDT
jgi:hypothetical protein